MIPSRILIIDPHPATREGVRQFLAADPARWEVCGCESNALQAIAQLARLQPDLAIVEYEGHGMDGLELAAQLGRLRRTIGVMLYTANTFPSALQRIVPAEVAGAVLKTEPLDELALGLETIRRRHRFRSGEITRLCRQAEEELQRTDPLSPIREGDIAAHFGRESDQGDSRSIAESASRRSKCSSAASARNCACPAPPPPSAWPCATDSSAESGKGIGETLEGKGNRGQSVNRDRIHSCAADFPSGSGKFDPSFARHPFS